MSEHTATPWHFKQALAEFAGPDEERDFAIYADDAIIAEAFHKVGHNTYAPSEANARRIVACVNTCEGMTTEELEIMAEVGTKEGRMYGVDLAAIRDCIWAVRDKGLSPENFLRVAPDLLAALEGVHDGVIAYGIIALPPVLTEAQPWVLITAAALRRADLTRAAIEKAKPCR